MKEMLKNIKILKKGQILFFGIVRGYEQSKSWDFKWMKSVTTPVEKMIAGNISVKKLKI